MDDLISTVLVSEFLKSCLFGSNLKESVTWLVIVYFLAISWNFIRLVCYYSSVEEHDVENSIYFTELLTLSSVVIRPKTIRIVDSMHLVDDAVDFLVKLVNECEFFSRIFPRCCEIEAEYLTCFSTSRRRNFPVLGMDCEMKSRVGRPPLIQLLQFATDDGRCVLFQISFMPSIPSSLSRLLSNNDIWKVGVGVYNDAWYLLQQYPGQFQIKGTFDVRYLAQSFRIQERGLKSLAQRLLQADWNFYQSKGQWSDIELTPDRAMYAAIDAYLGVLLFKRFFHMFVGRVSFHFCSVFLTLRKLRSTSKKVIVASFFRTIVYKKYGRVDWYNANLRQQLLREFLNKWKHKTSQQYRNN